MTENGRKTTKLLAAAVGGSALIAMGVVTALVGGPSASGPSIVSGGMTRGETVTQVAVTTTLPGSVLPTEKASPAVKATAYK